MFFNQPRQFVFVSHANKDKKAIRYIVEALIANGIKVWLDNPRKMGFTRDEIQQHFVNLRGGERWRDQIHDAANAAMCMLVCWSKTSVNQSRAVIMDEVAIGRSQRKLVACRIDDCDYLSLSNGYGDEQTVDLYAADDGSRQSAAQRQDAIADLVDDIKNVIDRTGSDAKKYKHMRDLFTPYLIDRRNQEGKAREVIGNVAKGNTQALLIKAPRNECLDQFRERLRRFTSSQCLPNARSWEEVLVDWPSYSDHKSFSAAYEAQLSAALGVHQSELTERLKRRTQVPIAYVSTVSLREWKKQERKCVLEWLRWWRTISMELSHLKAAPILCVELPDAKPGWSTVPNVNDGGQSAKRVWRDLGAVEKISNKRSEFVAGIRLDVLHPVQKTDAHKWMQKVVPETGSEAWVKIDQTIDEAFEHARRRGLTMKDFASKVSVALQRNDLDGDVT